MQSILSKMVNGKGKTKRKLSWSHESIANITPNEPSKFQKIFLIH